jgi:hypothetical protein
LIWAPGEPQAGDPLIEVYRLRAAGRYGQPADKEEITMRKITAFVLTAALIAGPSAFADSKSAADFLLKTCLPTMDELSKVEMMAREGGWTYMKPAVSLASQKSHSVWLVAQGEDRFVVSVWINHILQSDANICYVDFSSNEVNREAFFNYLSATLELTFLADTRFPQIRNEVFKIQSAHPKGLGLSIQSRTDGNVWMASIFETFVQAAPRPLPDGSPQ